VATREIWRNPDTGERYIVELSSGGDVVGAAGPILHSDPEQALSERFVPDPNLLGTVQDLVQNHVLEYELDEDGNVWNFGENV
jgi:hypothetical protein